MADQTHEYETHIEWTAQWQGRLSSPPRPSIEAGAPPEFGGPDNVWTPEHLLVAAVNSCVMLTFIAVAGNSKVPFRSYTSSARGTLEKVEGRGMVITRVSVHPRVTIGADVDRVKVERLVKIAEKNCFISNSLNAAVTLEPDIVVE